MSQVREVCPTPNQAAITESSVCKLKTSSPTQLFGDFRKRSFSFNGKKGEGIEKALRRSVPIRFHFGQF
jgi:hypothetical protein